jgi:hypothetical protein
MRIEAVETTATPAPRTRKWRIAGCLCCGHYGESPSFVIPAKAPTFVIPAQAPIFVIPAKAPTFVIPAKAGIH